jgi:hypothetical protein
MQQPHAPCKLALPVHGAAAAVLVSFGDWLHWHLGAVGQWRARHWRRAPPVALRRLLILAVPPLLPRAGLALRLALHSGSDGGGRR